jgi:hypothetical protein
VDVPIGSKCHSGRSELGLNVQAAPPQLAIHHLPLIQLSTVSWTFTRSAWRVAAESEWFLRCVAVSSVCPFPASHLHQQHLFLPLCAGMKNWLAAVEEEFQGQEAERDLEREEA